MRLTLMIALTTAIALGLTARAADAKPPLSEVDEITNSVMAIAIANKARKRCSDISGRMFKAWNYVRSVQARARELGYSKAEIDAFLADKEAEAQLERDAAALVRASGYNPDNNEEFCAFAHNEIAKSSLIGSFLRAN